MRRDLRLDRRGFLAGLSLGAGALATPLLAEAPLRSPRPNPRPDGLLRSSLPDAAALAERAGLGGAHSIAVMDLETAQMLDTVSPDHALPPASSLKALSALYALRALGPAHRFTTRLVTNGTLSADGTLQGDLILAGGGDPVLDTDALADLARLLKSGGVSRITGGFFFDSAALPAIETIDPGQPAHLGYSPAISGLNLNFNRVYFEWVRRGGDYAVSMDARSATLRPPVRVSSMSVQPRDAPLFTYERRDGRDRWTVARGALGTGGGRWLPARDPAGYAADVFRTLAGEQGLSLPQPQPLPEGQDAQAPDMAELARNNSPALPAILRGMLKYSTNLTAECVGLAASRGLGAQPTSLGASGGQMAAWLRAQMPYPAQIDFADHSGLGDTSRISAQSMIAALALSGAQQQLAPLLKPVLLRDPGGRELTNAQTAIIAKTGTLNFVSALAGYILPPSGRRYAFAIFSADLERRAGLSRAQRERPAGGASWARRARKMQNDILYSWSRGLLA